MFILKRYSRGGAKAQRRRKEESMFSVAPPRRCVSIFLKYRRLELRHVKE